MRTAFACFVFLESVSVTFGITGDTCSDPFIIPSLPFTDTGSICSFSDDTDGGC
jgi:hypothetical protein